MASPIQHQFVDEEGQGSDLFLDTPDDALQDLPSNHPSNANQFDLLTSGSLDLRDIHPALLADDSVSQELLQAHVYDESVSSTLARQFRAIQPTNLRLSRLQKLYDTQNKAQAVAHLQSRRTLSIDSRYTVSWDSSNLTWATDKHFLDYLLTRPSVPGLDMIIPNVDRDWDFNFDLDFTRDFWDFRGNRNALHFDPSHRMFYIGTCRNKERAFLSFVPSNLVGRDALSTKIVHSKESTVMSSRDRRVVIAMFAYFLERNGIQGVSCSNDGYPDVLSKRRLNNSTNILEYSTISLNLTQLKALNKDIVDNYEDWYSNAPDSYASPIFDGALPMVITILYGQNKSFDVSPRSKDPQAWENQRDYSKCLLIQFALATHFSCYEVYERVFRDPETIVQQHPDGIFTTADPNTREEIDDLSRYDKSDAHGHILPIFDSNGNSIVRTDAIVDFSGPQHAILQDLSRLPSIFETSPQDSAESNWDVVDSEDEIQDLICAPVPYDVYPLAFTRNYGQYQAKGVPIPFNPIISDISAHLKSNRRRSRPNHRRARPNRTISSDSDSDSSSSNSSDNASDDASDDDDTDSPSSAVLLPVSSQGYNYLSHHVRRSSSTHIVQKGILTATAAGGYASSRKNSNTASNLFDYCKVDLPHHRYSEKLQALRSLTNIDTSWRHECVYTLNIANMKDDLRSGKAIFNNVISPLLSIYTKRPISNALRSSFIILKPNVFPNLLLWTTYPLISLIDDIWNRSIKPALQANSFPDPYLLEFLSVCERTLNFAHTGSAKVISSSLMNPLWVGTALCEDGWPVFSKIININSNHSGPHSINKKLWPINSKTDIPHISSKRAQELTYGLSHFQGYLGTFAINHAFQTSPTNKAWKSFKSVDRAVLISLNVFFSQYVRDVVAFVKSAVNTRIKEIDDDDDAPNAQKAFLQERKTALKSWSSSKHPLSLGHNTHSAFIDLSLAVSDDEGTAGSGLPIAGEEKMSISQFFSAFYDMAKPTSPKKRMSPAIPDGPSFPILQAALRHAFQVMASDSITEQTIRNRLLSFFVILISEHRINYFPHLPFQSGPGARVSLPSIKSWSRLGGSSQEDKANCALAAAAPSTHALLHKAAKLTARADPRTSWSINDYKISQAHLVLKKEVLPLDWSIKNSSLSGADKDNYVGETYSWARLHFKTNYTSLECQLAIILAFLVSKQLPVVCWKRPKADRRPTKQEDFTNFVQQLDWTSPPKGKKGYISSGIYFTQLSTYILAMLVSSSPLRRHAANNSYSLGAEWNKKHSQKSIAPVALVRLRLAWAKSMGIFGSHKLNDSYGIYTDADLRPLLKTVIRHLSPSNSFGPFNLCKFIFGVEVALTLAEKGQVQAPNYASGSRQNVIVISDNDDANASEEDVDDGVIDLDDSDDVERPTKRRRMA